jgi:hypothetical protein
VGKALSGALVSVLLGLAASSADVVDLRRVLRSTGALLLAFLSVIVHSLVVSACCV